MVKYIAEKERVKVLTGLSLYDLARCTPVDVVRNRPSQKLHSGGLIAGQYNLGELPQHSLLTLLVLTLMSSPSLVSGSSDPSVHLGCIIFESGCPMIAEVCRRGVRCSLEDLVRLLFDLVSMSKDNLSPSSAETCPYRCRLLWRSIINLQSCWRSVITLAE